MHSDFNLKTIADQHFPLPLITPPDFLESETQPKGVQGVFLGRENILGAGAR